MLQDAKAIGFVLVTAIVLGTVLYKSLRGLSDEMTARRQAERSSDEMEQRLIAATDRAQIGLVIVSEEHRYLYANRTYGEILNLGDTDLVGRRVADVLAPVYERQISPRLDQALQGQRVEYELRMPPRGKEESERSYQVSYEPGRDPNGKSVVVVVIFEVTERERVAEVLRARVELQERLLQVSQMLPGVVYSIRLHPDGSTSVPTASASLEDYVGYRHEDIRDDGNRLFYDVHPDDRLRVQAAFHASASTLTLFAEEFRYLHPKKGEIWLSARSQPIRQADGSVLWHGFTTDVTARKESELLLLMHKRVLEETGRLAKMGGWTLDPHTGKVFLTEEVYRIHDLEPGSPFSKEVGVGFYTPEARPVIEAALKEAATQGKPFDLELEIVSAKGVRKWVRSIGHPAVVAGSVVQIHGSFQEITELRRLSAARERQERRISMLAEISGRLVVSENPGEMLGEIFERLARELQVDVYANYMVAEAGKRLVLTHAGGLSAEQRAAFAHLEFGQSLCGVVAERQEPVLSGDLELLGLPQAAGIIALGIKAYAGHPLIARGTLIGTISFGSRTKEAFDAEDIQVMKTVADQVAASVERSRLIEAMREGDERFREVAENIQEVFWLREVENNRIIYVSPAFETIWGRSCRSLYDSVTAWSDSLHPADRDRVIEADNTVQVTGPNQEIYRIIRPDGTVRWVRDRSFPVRDDRGKVLRIVGVAEDITEQRELEEKFLRAQRMEALGTLASGIAHDLNNILAPMLMVGGLFRDKLTAVEDQALLDMVERSARRGAGIVGQLLTFSRGLDGKRLTLQPRHILKEVAHLMEETLPKDIQVSLRVPSDLWSITADPTQVHQVLLNLCVNARDAMPGGGRLTISAANDNLAESDVLHYAPAKPGPYVRISVRDTGSGIPREIIPRIFDPFFTTKDVGKGTGLGLSTVLGIVKSHHGIISVTSEPGQGTEFQVCLPASTAPSAEEVAGPTDMPTGHGELILLVDDEEPIRQATREVLVSHGYRTLSAPNGGEAISLFVRHRGEIRVVVTDLMMPVIGGIELSRWLREFEPGVKIIACSGLEDQGKWGELEHLGVPEVLAKPFTAHALLKAIERILSP